MKHHPHQHPSHSAAVAQPKPSAQAKAFADCATGSADSVQQTQHIAEIAYFIAMKRGFVGGNCLQDWLEAERLVHSSCAPA